MSNSKTLAGLLIGTIILSFLYIGNFSASSNLENNIFGYFGAVVQAATSGNSGVSLTATVGSVLTVSVDNATAAFGNLTPGTPIYTSTTVSIFSNNNTGYNVKINRDNNPTSTLTLDGLPATATNTIPDATSWDSTGNGNATSSTATSTGIGEKLSFRVRSTESTGGTCFDASEEQNWWGLDGSTPLYAGFPTSTVNNATTFNCSSFQSATTTAKHYYRLDAPSNQYTGDYSGGITYTAAVNP